MSIMNAAFLGLLQGFLEFLPVSSFGHLSAIEHTLGMNQNLSMLFETILHLGSVLAILILTKKEIRRLRKEFLGIVSDLILNFQILLRNRRGKKHMSYRRVLKTPYRKFAALLFVTMIPTFILGFLARNLAELVRQDPMGPGICLLLNAIFLIVLDFSRAGGIKTPSSAGFATAMWVGICQGLSVFPGISRLAFTMGAGLLCGFSRKMALKYSVIALIPAVFGAFILEIPGAVSAGAGHSDIPVFIVGGICSFLVSYLSARVLLKITQSLKLRVFALYSFAAGAAALALSLNII